MLKDVSFSLYSGEILSIAGIAGSGQKELCEAIAGLYKVHSGSIKFKGEEMVGKTPKEIIKKGISMSFIPEDRLGMGLVASMDIVDNILLKQYQKKTGFFIDRKPSKVKLKKLLKNLKLKRRVSIIRSKTSPAETFKRSYLEGNWIQIQSC
jgi:simple sugar transport system ATP-binding protein